MAKKVGRNTILMENNPMILSFASVVSKKEGDGPLSKYFDIINEDPLFDQDTWEKAENIMQQQCINYLLNKASLSTEDIDFLFAGDLQNQCAGSHYGVRNYKIPFLGLYGACSTMAESLSMASIFVDSKIAKKCLAITSSHFGASEKQFRFPCQYGGQRTPTAQWNVTGCGSIIVAENPDNKKNALTIKAVTIGTIEDWGITDVNNMGAAMAPAAANTILSHFENIKEDPNKYDLILTGDLGYIGSEILLDLLSKEGLDISQNHNDCGQLIFDRIAQDVHSGGSGCGCSASVLCSYILKSMQKKELRNILFIATGALMNPVANKQNRSIPGIAHLVHISNY